MNSDVHAASRSLLLGINEQRYLLLIIVAVLFCLSLILAPGGSFSIPDGFDTSQLILEVRLPRTLLTFITGASLGLSGAVLQGYSHNPLAESGLLGINSWAALGAVIAFYFGPLAALAWWVPLGGIIGAAVGLAALGWLARHSMSMTGFILAGVALSALASALTTLALNLAPNPFAALEVIFWLLGSASDKGLPQVLLIIPAVALGCWLLLRTGPSLYGWSLGPDVAATMGISPQRLRTRIMLGCGLCVGSTIAMTGSIAFVGLVVPHLLRPLVRHRPDKLLLHSLLGGGALLLLADTLIRILPMGNELKLGVVTALIGTPVLFHLLYRQRQEE